jgi:hypothetical protein
MVYSALPIVLIDPVDDTRGLLPSLGRAERRTGEKEWWAIMSCGLIGLAAVQPVGFSVACGDELMSSVETSFDASNRDREEVFRG